MESNNIGNNAAFYTQPSNNGIRKTAVRFGFNDHMVMTAQEIIEATEEMKQESIGLFNPRGVENSNVPEICSNSPMPMTCPQTPIDFIGSATQDIDDVPSAFKGIGKHFYDFASIAFLHDGTPLPPPPLYKPKKLPECTRCRAHRVTSSMKGHRSNCPYALCFCKICQGTSQWMKNTFKLLTSSCAAKK